MGLYITAYGDMVMGDQTAECKSKGIFKWNIEKLGRSEGRKAKDKQSTEEESENELSDKSECMFFVATKYAYLLSVTFSLMEL